MNMSIKSFKTFLFTLMLFMVICIPVQAADVSTPYITVNRNIEQLENGDYIETTIYVDTITARAASSTSGSKMVEYKNAAGKTMWTVTVKGSFTYTGNSSKCTSASGSAYSSSSNWKVGAASASKSGNKAIAKVTATQYMGGTAVGSATKSVTLTCSPKGVLS